ncbi:MAG: enoyl-CoA hydratase-related protein [Prolixibacteraceae bacterium]
MSEYNQIKLRISGNRATISLDRPGKHNALNPEMIRELHEAVTRLEQRDDLQFVVLSGEGPSFCAGADLEWFAGSVRQDQEQIRQEYELLADLLEKLVYLPQITIAVAHQNVLGGGNGLLAACDFAVAEEMTSFAFSEVRLGIIPAIIMPVVFKRVASRNLRKLMFSGERFGAAEAHLIGLIDFIAGPGESMKMANKLMDELGSVSPGALKACKQLILKVDSGEVGLQNGAYTASVLAGLIHTEEAREGLQAFFEKRSPVWIHQK